MAGNRALGRLLQKYEELRNWTENSDDPKRNRLKLQGYSVGVNNAGVLVDAASNSTSSITIHGLISPPEELTTRKLIKIDIQVPMLYPHEPPIVYFRSQISHPNVDHRQRLCIPSLDLERNWQQLSLIDVIKTVIQIFDQPQTNDAVHVGMAGLFDRDRLEYNQNLSQMIEQHGESP